MASKTKRKYMYWPGTYGQFSFNGGKPARTSLSTICDYARSGTHTPFFKRTIRSGAQASGGLLTTNQTVYYKPPKVVAQYSDRTWRPTCTGEQITATALSNWNPDSHSDRCSYSLREYVSNAALTGIIKKIRKHETSDFAGPTFVGELRETVSMLRSPVKALRLKTGLFTDLSMRILRDKQAKGGRFKPEPWYRVLSDTYLEWIFGAAPLIGDIGAIADAYLDKKAAFFPNKGFKRLSFRFSDDSFSNTGTLDLGWPGTYIYVKTDKLKHERASIQYIVWLDNSLLFADTQMGNLSELSRLRFDLGELLPTAWELLPWSFLIDYWTNIGDVMSCAFNFNRNVVFAQRTDFETVTYFHGNFRGGSSDPSFNILVNLEPHQFTSQHTRVERVPVSKLGFPGLNFSLPSVGQFSNMAALMVSLSKANPFRGFTLK